MNLATWSRISLALGGTARAATRAAAEEEEEKEEEEVGGAARAARAAEEVGGEAVAVVGFVVFDADRSTSPLVQLLLLPLLVSVSFFLRNRSFLMPSNRLVGVEGAIGEAGGEDEGPPKPTATCRRSLPLPSADPAASLDTTPGAPASNFPILSFSRLEEGF